MEFFGSVSRNLGSDFVKIRLNLNNVVPGGKHLRHVAPVYALPILPHLDATNIKISVDSRHELRSYRRNIVAAALLQLLATAVLNETAIEARASH